MKKPIYLDYMATTPVDPRVAEKMMHCLCKEGCFGNPASQSHLFGYEASELVLKARKQVAELINAEAKEIIWTSGATEADNLAIKGVAQFYQRQGKHIVTMSTEHKAVLDPCKYLQSSGFEVTFLNPQENGLLNLTELEKAIRKDTILISIMLVNNETGVVQDVESIGKLAKKHGLLFHVDAAQAPGKVAIDVKKMQIDLMSLSGHKCYGPKGIGALYVKQKPPVRLMPQIHGGGHERGMRSGTLATHQIVGMGEAFAIAKNDFEKDREHSQKLSTRFWEGVCELPEIYLNGDLKNKIPNCFNLYFAGIDGESLLLSLRDIAVSTGSACNSASADPSHVLAGMGLQRQRAFNSIRFSFGRFTTEAEIDTAASCIQKEVSRLRSMSPIWDIAAQKSLTSEPKR